MSKSLANSGLNCQSTVDPTTPHIISKHASFTITLWIWLKPQERPVHANSRPLAEINCDGG